MILNLGCGMTRIHGAVNHDISLHSPHVDVAHDLNVLPWPWRDEEFSDVFGLDVFEHLLVDVDAWLNEAWRVIAGSGLLIVRVPDYRHENAYTDPTHRRFFAPKTFDYWDKSKELHHKYGAFYFGKAARWWRVEDVSKDDDGNLTYRLRKDP